MADQDRKTGRLKKDKYVILKPCPECYPNAGYDPKSSFGVCGACNGSGVVRPSDEGAAYFVLRIDCDEDGRPHDPNARAALVHYAACVADSNPQFARDILDWLARLVESAD